MKVCVAMSGGVDSSVAAYLLKNAGYQVFGIFLKFWSPPNQKKGENRCCSVEAAEDARKIAAKLDIPLYTLDFKDIFKQKIVDDFICQYQNGQTPNPCIRCNKYIKFGKLLAAAKKYGAGYLATGHYAKIVKVKDNYELHRAVDTSKDQSYFLYNLTQNQLPYLLFPLGDYKKSRVRSIAKHKKFKVAEKKESQEICFIPGKKYGDFLKNQLKLKKGPIITTTGEKMGEHDGLPLYTIGQRKRISKFTKPGPYYVVDKKIQTNSLIVTKNPDDPNLYKNSATIHKVNWLSGKPPSQNQSLTAQIRYQHKPVKIKIISKKTNYQIIFNKPQKAVTPGQSLVIYENDKLLGGGIIKKYGTR